MISAWQTSLVPEHIPERLIHFGRMRCAATAAVIVHDAVVYVEGRLGRKLRQQIVVGYRDQPDFEQRLRDALRSVQELLLADIVGEVAA